MSLLYSRSQIKFGESLRKQYLLRLLLIRNRSMGEYKQDVRDEGHHAG